MIALLLPPQVFIDLCSFQDALLQASEAVDYHEQFETLTERYNHWMTDAESRLAKFTTTNDANQSDTAIDEHCRHIEVSNDRESSVLQLIFISLEFNP